MDVQKESELRARILAAAEVVGEAYRVAVPEGLRTATGNRFERELQRLEAMTSFLEEVALETAQPGLSKKLNGYTDLNVLRQTDDEDLMQLDGVGKSSVKAIRKALKREEANGESDSQGELVREDSESETDGSGEGPR